MGFGNQLVVMGMGGTRKRDPCGAGWRAFCVSTMDKDGWREDKSAAGFPSGSSDGKLGAEITLLGAFCTDALTVVRRNGESPRPRLHLSNWCHTAVKAAEGNWASIMGTRGHGYDSRCVAGPSVRGVPRGTYVRGPY